MKKRILFSICFSLLLFSQLPAQVTFQKSYTIYSNGIPSVEQTSDGGYIIAGRKLIKTNAIGDTLWTKSYDFGSSHVSSAVQTIDGGFAITGYTFSFGAGNTDCFLTKTDSLGNIAWSKAYGGLYADEAHSIQQTADGGFIIAGRTRSFFNFGGWYSYLVRTDLNGNLLWSKAIRAAGDCKATTVRQTSDGGFIVGGYFGVFDLGTYDNRAFVTKLDINGNTAWSKVYNGPGTEVINCIQQTDDGGYIFTGTAAYFDTSNVIVMFLMKTCPFGVLQWSRYYARDFTFGNWVEQTNDGGYIITGNIGIPASYIDVCLIKTDNLGDTLWTKAFGGTENDGGTCVKETSDGGFIIAGSSTGFGYGFYVIKTDSVGNGGCNESPTFVKIVDTLVSELAVTYEVDSGGTATPFTTLPINGTEVISICSTNTTDNEELTLKNHFHIFPNPSTGYFTLTSERTITKGSIHVFNVHGAMVFKENILNASTKDIHLNNVTPGFYFVKVYDGEKQYRVEKLIICAE